MVSYKQYQDRWLQQQAVYSPSELTILGYQVMQDWESQYMKRLAEIATSQGGHVLEVGFGLGISAGFVQASPAIHKHTVIEAHPEVVKFARTRFNQNIAAGKMEILNSFWEDATRDLPDASFDGILFDTCPLHQETVFFHYFPFFPEAYRLLRPNGIFTYFSDEPREISADHERLLRQAGFQQIDFEVVPVTPPADCRYWTHNTIVAPIIRK
ncbi:MAG: methyltransferase domain-containing protein [Synechococcales cyanobacterium M58_A2018_015]|nr:methyltransferase domain-containing protein [Synechococcales cyanobacterium M58_A2018_015]